jgi:hypothetical protein
MTWRHDMADDATPQPRADQRPLHRWVAAPVLVAGPSPALTAGGIICAI